MFYLMVGISAFLLTLVVAMALVTFYVAIKYLDKGGDGGGGMPLFMKMPELPPHGLPSGPPPPATGAAGAPEVGQYL